MLHGSAVIELLLRCTRCTILNVYFSYLQISKCCINNEQHILQSRLCASWASKRLFPSCICCGHGIIMVPLALEAAAPGERPGCKLWQEWALNELLMRLSFGRAAANLCKNYSLTESTCRRVAKPAAQFPGGCS